MAMKKRNLLGRGWLGAAVAGMWFVLPLSAAEPAAKATGPVLVTTEAKEIRNRANVLLLGETLSTAVAERLQARWVDEANVFRPVQAVKDVATLGPGLEALLAAKPWHVVVLAVPAGGGSEEKYADALRAIVAAVKKRGAVPLWCSLPVGDDRTRTVRMNDVARAVMRTEGVEAADLYGALRGRPAGGAASEAGVLAEALSPALKRALFSRSTPAAKLPPGETRDPARLLADAELLRAPMELPEAKGTTAMIYRAEEGQWQFNLHSFIAHHEGKFWAMWSSGRVNEDSSSQFMRYATSVDGRTWSESAVLAADPDGESGPWRWMASGIYTDGGKLYALGSLNQGNAPPGGPWSQARLVRYVWTGTAWKEDKVVAENCVVYFPPLRVEGRDFFVWRDSRAYFYTGYAPAGTDQFQVTRVPGPLPDYRMSETGSFVDPEGVVHLIIRDQGYTRRLYHSVSYDAGATWTVPVKTNYPDAASKNMTGRLSNGWYYLISNPKEAGANARDPLAITFSRDGWTFSRPMALRKNAPALRYKGGAKGSFSFQYSHAIEHDGQLWVIYATNKEDIEVTAYPIQGFGLGG